MWARRLPWVLIVLVSGVMVVSGVITFFTHSPEVPNTSGRDEQVAQQVELCRNSSIEEWNRWDSGEIGEENPDYVEYLSQFESAEAFADENCNPAYFGDQINEQRFCFISMYEPTVSYREACPDLAEGSAYGYEEQRFTIQGTEYRTAKVAASGIVPVTSLVLLAVAAVLGASFVGAEYAAATIETTLLWEPRRKRVLAAKFGVAALCAFLIHAFLLGVLVLAMVPSGLWRGTFVGFDAVFWNGMVGVVLRGGLIAAAIAAIALAISTMTRGTVGGVVALLGYIAISPTIGFTLLKSFRRFDLTENMTAFANGGEVSRFVQDGSGYHQAVYSHGAGLALLVVVVYVAIAVALAMAVFTRRDID
jgi:ABC-type transport system involved in multi-copper enzyme maturation permease subunit